MNTKFTQGQWIVCHSSDNEPYIGIERLGQNAAVIASLQFTDFSKESEANAKLIATAPELLNACISVKKTIQDVWDQMPEPIRHSMIEVLDRAIKKATE